MTRFATGSFCSKIHEYELPDNSQYQKNFTLQKNFTKHKSDFSFTELYCMQAKSIIQKKSSLGEQILFYRKRCLHNSQFGFQYKKVLLLTKKFAKTNICITLRFNLYCEIFQCKQIPKVQTHHICKKIESERQGRKIPRRRGSGKKA
jgi:hypothetical protein